ncbi:MAG TPA: RyR domain-containing protein [Micromonosporaceae bacterium]
MSELDLTEAIEAGRAAILGHVICMPSAETCGCYDVAIRAAAPIIERAVRGKRGSIEWPSGSLTERRAIFVYEGARIAAAGAEAPIVPERWSQRDDAFRAQFLDVIDMMCGPARKSSPEELHDDWVKAYEAMGWRYGSTRDVEARTHPDMVPYDQLGQLEQDKDSVFVALCEIARQWIREAK